MSDKGTVKKIDDRRGTRAGSATVAVLAAIFCCACGPLNQGFAPVSQASRELVSGGDDSAPPPDVPSGAVPAPAPPPALRHSKPLLPLGWEKNHSERSAWSAALFASLDEKFEIFDSASDIEQMRPDYESLTRDQKLTVWAEIICWTAYYESGWNPKSQAVDVGTADNRDSWSIGLMQVSVVDQQAAGMDMGWSFEDLLDPVNNLNFSLMILERQIKKRGKLLIAVGESGLYFATLHPGGKYDVSGKVAAKAQAMRF